MNGVTQSRSYSYSSSAPLVLSPSTSEQEAIDRDVSFVEIDNIEEENIEEGMMDAEENVERVDEQHGDSTSPNFDSALPAEQVARQPPSLVTATQFATNTSISRKEAARRALFAKNDTKDIYLCKPMLDRMQAHNLVSKMEAVLRRLTNPAVTARLQSLRDTYAKNIDSKDPVSMKEWAITNEVMHQLLSELKKYDGKDCSTMPYLGFLKLNIQHLEFVSRYMYRSMAQEALVAKFTQELEARGCDNPMFNSVTTQKVSAEYSIVPKVGFSMGLELSKQDTEYFDDEGYLISSEVGGVNVPLNINMVAAKVTGQVTASTGTYNYARFARAHAICYLGKLIEANNSDPSVRCLLSRDGILGNDALVGGNNELADFYAFQKEYMGEAAIIARSFSLLLSLNYGDRETRVAEEAQHKIKYYYENNPGSPEVPEALIKAVGDVDATPIPGDAGATATARKRNACQPITHSATLPALPGDRKAVLLQGVSKTLGGAIKAKIGFSESFLQFKISGSVVEHSQKNTKATRYAGFCQLIQDRFPTAEFKAKLKADLKTQGDKLRCCLFDDLDRKRLNPTAQEIGDALKIPALEMDLDFEIHKTRPNALQQDINRLIEDFDCYTNLHAQKDAAAITAFHAKYEVDSNEKCLQKMAILAAYFFVECEADTGPDAEKRKASLLQLEANIHSTGIPHNPDTLRPLINAEQNYFIKTTDTVVQGSFNVGGGWRGFFSGSGGCSFKFTNRELLHFNPLRSGNLRSLEFSLSANAAVNQQFLKYLSQKFGVDLPDLKNISATNDADTFTGSLVFTYKSFKPAESGDLPHVQLFQRGSTQLNNEFSPKVPVPTPVGVVTLGYSRTDTNSTMFWDQPYSNSMLLSMTHYLHALFTSTIRANPDGSEGVTMQRSYWHQLWDKHPEKMRELMLNIADCNVPGEGNSKSRLRQEFDFIEQRFLRQASEEEKEKAKYLIDRLVTCAKNLKIQNTEANYQAVKDAYIKYLIALLPHWMMERETHPEAYGLWRYNFNMAAA